MAYTVEPSNQNEASIENSNKSTDQLSKIYEESFTSGAVEKIIVVDPRLDKSLQINASSNTYDVEITTTLGAGNTDITDAGVPWIKIVDASTDDYVSGGGDINRGILAIRITCASVTTSFKVCAQHLGTA